jgi:hypothetical protein
MDSSATMICIWLPGTPPSCWPTSQNSQVVRQAKSSRGSGVFCLLYLFAGICKKPQDRVPAGQPEGKGGRAGEEGQEKNGMAALHQGSNNRIILEAVPDGPYYRRQEVTARLLKKGFKSGRQTSGLWEDS